MFLGLGHETFSGGKCAKGVATSIPGAVLRCRSVHRSVPRAARCPSRRARHRAPPSGSAGGAESATWRRRTPVSAFSCGVAAIVVVVVLRRRAPLAEVLALVGREA